MIDLTRLRAETPSTAKYLHLNHAGASPMPAPVAEAVRRHLDLEAEIGGYAAEQQAEPALEDFYSAFADLLGASRDEIAFVENATRAWDMAFYGVDFRPGDRIITCLSEYGSNYVAYLHAARAKGVAIDVAANDASGQVSVEDIERLIRPNTRLIAITHVPTQGGLVNPAEAIGRVARTHGVLFLLDACQSLGQLPVDVGRIGCDFLSGTGRKFLRGPRGTGVLYARKAVLQQFHPPFVDAYAASWSGKNEYVLRNDARRFENWERFVAGQIALGKAVRYAMDIGIDAIADRVQSLAARMRSLLAEDRRTRLADLGAQQCGIVTFRIEGEDPHDTVRRLAAENIQGWQSTIDWARMDFEYRGIEKLVRLSVHYLNTEDEIDRACRVICERV